MGKQGSPFLVPISAPSDPAVNSKLKRCTVKDIPWQNRWTHPITTGFKKPYRFFCVAYSQLDVHPKHSTIMYNHSIIKKNNISSIFPSHIIPICFFPFDMALSPQFHGFAWGNHIFQWNIALTLLTFGATWWFITLSKYRSWVMTPVISGLSLLPRRPRI